MTTPVSNDAEQQDDPPIESPATAAAFSQQSEVTNSSRRGSNDSWEKNQFYNWRRYFRGGNFFRWLVTGIGSGHADEEGQTDEEVRENLKSFARLLILLREYYQLYGLPKTGGPKDQEYVLREVTKDLYSGGSPIWSLETAMQRAAEGLTGKQGVDFFLLPRKAFIYAPSSGAATMFRINRGFNIQKLTAMEQVLVRLASFASNTHGFSNIPTRNPTKLELLHAFRQGSVVGFVQKSKQEMAKEILDLASEAEGLFFFVNSKQRPDTLESQLKNKSKKKKKTNAIETIQEGDEEDDDDARSRRSSDEDDEVAFGEEQDDDDDDDDDENNDVEEAITSTNAKKNDMNSEDRFQVTSFWTIEDHICDLFSRLAATEAIKQIDVMDKTVLSKPLYSNFWIIVFRFLSSAGAAAIWFGGDWVDILVAGTCGVLVGMIGGWKVLSKEERVIYEAIASFVVGLIAGLVSLKWPNHSCFGAMAVSGVLDILQGFRVVYSVIEVMSKHTVAGTADFIEGLLFTGLIAYFLKLGQNVASGILDIDTDASYIQCNSGIDQWWYFFWSPVASIAWSGLFTPEYEDLPFMAFHGVLAFAVSWGCEQSKLNYDYQLFVAAFTVTLSAGIISRFTGRQAMGNTVSGLYVLVPGAYLVRSLFASLSLDFLAGVFYNAAIIGIGAWTGTIMCSPTIFGTNLNLLRRDIGRDKLFKHREKHIRKHGTGAMLFF